MAKRKPTAKTADRHALYEASVQCVDADIDFAIKRYRKIHGTPPRLLKEDFCGTASAACEFVRRHRLNHAIGVDLDAEVLDWGRTHNLPRLKSRVAQISLHEANVLDVRTPKVDLTLALNFSYYIFKERESLLAYFKSARLGLKPGGLFILDAYGGSEAQVPMKEERKVDGFTYVWDQCSYNPITSEVMNYIHFRFSDGSKMKRAFAYDWRLWSLREIQDTLHAAGFRSVQVYWEGWDKNEEEGNGKFKHATNAENCEGWVSYIVAQK